jgi:hypothetical protein
MHPPKTWAPFQSVPQAEQESGIPVGTVARAEKGTPVVLSNRNLEALLIKLNLVKQATDVQGWKSYKPRLGQS